MSTGVYGFVLHFIEFEKKRQNIIFRFSPRNFFRTFEATWMQSVESAE